MTPNKSFLINFSAGAVLIMLALGIGGSRLVSTVQEIERLPRVGESEIISQMKKISSRSDWVYTLGSIYPFYANVNVIPELAVIPAKRIWSGRLSQEEILQLVKSYKPRLILLRTPKLPLEAGIWEFTKHDYSLICEENGTSLFAAKTLDR